MEKQRIFLHIPKTGGTTLDCAINHTDWVKEHDTVLYRHIQVDTKLSNAGDVFEKVNFHKYKNFDIFTMLRHPVDRLISEYFFVRDRKEYYSLIQKQPKNLKEHAANPQTRNYMIAFLLGRRIYGKKLINREDLEKVKQVIDFYPIHVGIFEQYDKSLNYLSDVMGVKWPKKIDVKRITLNRPKLEEVDEDIKNLILENNQLDLELYNYCLEKLEAHNFKASKNFGFTKDKYGYIMKYTERFILAELFFKKKNINFLAINYQYFRDVNLAIQQKVPFFEGRTYVKSWNATLLDELINLDKDFPIAELRDPSFDADPLAKTEKMVSLIEQRIKLYAKLYAKPFQFSLAKVKFEKHTKEKKSFLSRLFGK